ncbi:MAG: ABC transporter permease [Bryobacteraceae bacterium]|jgi:predicted permease
MNWVGEFWRRLRFRLRGARFDQDLAEEMRLHVDLRAADKQTDGMAREAAQAAARRQFGNATRLQEISREAWGWTWLGALRQDLRYGMRTLAANPGFTLTAVLSLALGIGANTAIFSIVNAVMLRSLPVEDPQALVQVKLGDGPDDELNTPIWEQVRDHQQAFSGTLAYSTEPFDLSNGGESHLAEGIWVSGDFFRVLGVPPMMGRAFTRDDDCWGGGSSGPVAVISYNFWKRHFAADANVLGKTIRLNRQTFVVVGVTPPWFTGLDVDKGYDVAIPIGCQPILHGGGGPPDEIHHWWLRILGRIAPGDSVKQADDRMRAIAPAILRATLPADQNAQDQAEYLKSEFVLSPAGLGFSATRLRYRTALFALMASVALVLLIACANIANLLLARAAARQRELSVRMAIGASRRRIVRQLMTESLLLAMLGAAGGFLFALWGSRLLVGLLSTTGNPLEIGVAPDLRVLAFTIAVAILTALLFGLAPAIRGTRGGLNHALREGERGNLRGSSRFRLGAALVAGQIALSLVLLVGAGLFLGTLRNLLTVDPGFSRHNILLVSVDLPPATPTAQRIRTYREILSRLQAIPGVASAARSVLTPISPAGWAQLTYPEGFAAKSPRDTLVFFNRVSAGYFKTMKTPLLMGRDFRERDDLNSARVMIVNQSTARRFFGSANPIGKTIGLDKPGAKGERELYQIIGVVKDAKYNRIDEEPRSIAYLACEQDSEPGPRLRYTLRSDGPVETLIPSVRAAVSGVNRDISLEFRDFETQVNESLLRQRLVALLSSIFGSLALLLAVVGLYGVTAYTAARRKGEIGIRMALGAQRRSVIWLMLRGVGILLAAGISLGLAVSLALGRLVASLLYGIKPNAPAELAGAALILALAAAVAAYVPARRAARLNPMAALREE